MTDQTETALERRIASLEANVRAHEQVIGRLTETLRAALERYHRAYWTVHSAYDGECEHGFGPPATKCPNADCDDRELAEAWDALVAISTPPEVSDD